MKKDYSSPIFPRLWRVVSVALFALLLVALPQTGGALTFPDSLIKSMWLYHHLDEVLVLDVRDDPESYSSRRRISTTNKVFNPCGVSSAAKNAPVFGHIPGAILVPWQEIMVDRQVDGENLLQMVPDAVAFQALMQRVGVNNESLVVIAGRGMNSAQMAMATRLFWTMKYYGHEKVALLDGGTADWIAHNRRIRFNTPVPPPGNFTIKGENKEILATTGQVLQWSKDGSQQIVDARGRDYFDGLSRVEKYVSQNGEGHIPTAINMPAPQLFSSGSPATFLNLESLLAVADKNHVSIKAPTVFYCNVGLQGSLNWFVWHELLSNKKTRLYDGSMHGWSRDPEREVAGF